MADVLPSSIACSSQTVLCSTCNNSLPKYTCPRCSCRTCSLACSKKHKELTGCSGERDKVKYVPMKEYGWGTMMDDYVFLEDMGRRVGGWGKEIVRGGFDLSPAGLTKDSFRGMARGRGRGRGRGFEAMGRRRRPGAFSKKDYLKFQLEARDIYMELLPQGMERKKLNQSCWNAKNNTAQLTVSFTFHPPAPDPLQLSNPPTHPFTLLTHRNDLSSPLLTLANQAVSDAFKGKKRPKDADGPPEWLQYFLTPHPDDPDSFKKPICIMSARTDPRPFIQGTSGSRKRRKEPIYYEYDLEKPLNRLLKYTHFVEFPSLEFFEDGMFNGVTVDPENATLQRIEGDLFEEDDRPKKRRRVAAVAKAAMKGMLGDYGSEDEGEDGNKELTTGLSLLGAYAGSEEDDGSGDDDEDSTVNQALERGEKHLDKLLGNDAQVLDLGSASDDDGDDGEDVALDPAALLELVKQVQGREPWIDVTTEEDEVDWDNSDGENEDEE